MTAHNTASVRSPDLSGLAEELDDVISRLQWVFEGGEWDEAWEKGLSGHAHRDIAAALSSLHAAREQM